MLEITHNQNDVKYHAYLKLQAVQYMHILLNILNIIKENHHTITEGNFSLSLLEAGTLGR